MWKNMRFSPPGSWSLNSELAEDARLRPSGLIQTLRLLDFTHRRPAAQSFPSALANMQMGALRTSRRAGSESQKQPGRKSQLRACHRASEATRRMVT